LGLADDEKTGGTIYAVPSDRFDNLAVGDGRGDKVKGTQSRLRK
jgi:hypothetical protein